MPAVDERLQRYQQLLDVAEVQADGRLVEEEQRVRLALAGHGLRQPEALRLAARQRAQRLAEVQIVEADL